jgi:hypothetical protein
MLRNSADNSAPLLAHPFGAHFAHPFGAHFAHPFGAPSNAVYFEAIMSLWGILGGNILDISTTSLEGWAVQS